MRLISAELLRTRYKNIHPRTRKAHLNTAVGLVAKATGMIVSLLLVPLTIDYLDKEVYGVWLTISSLASMIALFDIGIGNGMRNKFSEAISKQDFFLAKSYISTSYVTFGLFQLILALLFLTGYKYIPWQRILNTSVNADELSVVILIVFMGISVKLVLDIISYALLALQESGIVAFFNLTSNILILLGTYLLLKTSTPNILYLSVITSVSPILVMLASSVFLYNSRLGNVSPSIEYYDKVYVKSLLSLGYKFFVIQIAVLVIFYTDNIIITQLFGPAAVTSYNVAFRYFNAINIVFSIVITPYWSAFTEASVKKENVWMKKAYRTLQKTWLALFVVVSVMIMVANYVYGIWIGNRLNIPEYLNICMGIFILVSCWNNITVSVMNGTGKIKLQLIYSIVSAVINIPLAIFFGKYIGLGSAGVVLGTSVSLLIGSVFGGIQAEKIISGKSEGIWDK